MQIILPPHRTTTSGKRPIAREEIESETVMDMAAAEEKTVNDRAKTETEDEMTETETLTEAASATQRMKEIAGEMTIVTKSGTATEIVTMTAANHNPKHNRNLHPTTAEAHLHQPLATGSIDHREAVGDTVTGDQAQEEVTASQEAEAGMEWTEEEGIEVMADRFAPTLTIQETQVTETAMEEQTMQIYQNQTRAQGMATAEQEQDSSPKYYVYLNAILDLDINTAMHNSHPSSENEIQNPDILPQKNPTYTRLRSHLSPFGTQQVLTQK